MFLRQLQKLQANGAHLMGGGGGSGGGGGGSSSSSSSSRPASNVTDRNGNAIKGVSNSRSTNTSSNSSSSNVYSGRGDSGYSTYNQDRAAYESSRSVPVSSSTSVNNTPTNVGNPAAIARSAAPAPAPAQESSRGTITTPSSTNSQGSFVGLGSRATRDDSSARRASIGNSGGLIGSKVVSASEVGVPKDMNGNTLSVSD